MPLASIGDVAARLGRPISADETPRVAAFLDDASALVEDFCDRDFTQHTNESFILPGVLDRQLDIPFRYTAGLVVSSVALDGAELPSAEWTLVAQTLWRDLGWDGLAVTVTGSWGYSTVPATVKAAVCSEVIRWMSVSPGIVAEKTGDLEVQFGATASTQGLSPAARGMLGRYRRTIRSLTLRRTDERSDATSLYRLC
ncbi:phage gp6-like head-tail connector protein [Streptomyces althioticus]|uniref:phage gp6-like head-tail connector protein n=1 Tax=Streptomyces althioticus TaxID=83380 RepID=UPI0036FDA333